jgi:biotin carboxyl carrier protein
VFLDGEVFRFDVVREGPSTHAIAGSLRTSPSTRASTRSLGTGSASAGHQASLAAPMPATVVRIQAAAGAAVKRGQTLVVLEAMKMELPVHAPADGTVVAIKCREGELVQPGEPLVEFEPARS